MCVRPAVGVLFHLPIEYSIDFIFSQVKSFQIPTAPSKTHSNNAIHKKKYLSQITKRGRSGVGEEEASVYHGTSSI